MASNSDWPLLATDLQLLEAELEERRHELSREADSSKKHFLFAQWIAVIGGVVLVALGAVGTALSASGNASPGDVQLVPIIGAVLSLVIGVFVLIGREMDWQREWLDKRAASEKLKHEYYFFLGRVRGYGKTDNPEVLLRQRLRAVERDLVRRSLSGKGATDEHE